MSGRWVTVALLLSLPALYYVLAGRHHLQRIRALHDTIERVYDSAPDTDEQSRRLFALDSEIGELQAWRDELSESLGLEQQSPPLMLLTSAKLQSLGLETERAEVVPSTVEPPFSSQRVRLVVLGDMPQLFRFIAAIETDRPPGRVVSLNVHAVSAAMGTLRAELDVVRFWRGDS